MTDRLEMRSISKAFGATRALDEVHLSVSPGEVMALVGENGAGKSTLMKVLSGALMPDSGEMRLEGKRYTPRNPLEAREAGVAMIYQELSLAPHLSVMENILLGIEPVRLGLLDWGAMKEQGCRALKQVGLEAVAPETPVHRLSVGQQQLVEIARAVALECRVLVLDEPTSSLTQQDIEKLFSLMLDLKARNIAIVYISHFLEEIQEISDRFTVLRDGSTVGAGVTEETTVEDIIALMVGRNVEDLYPRSNRQVGETVLEIKDLAGLSGPVSASLALRKGEVLGISGLIGAGRTELLRTIFGLNPVVRGDIRVAQCSGPAGWDKGVGMVSEDRKKEGLATGLSIADNLTMPLLPSFLRPRKLQEACRPWIEKIPIKCSDAGQRVADLSGGNQQKVALARLLHTDVGVLLLDEPTRGIDVGSKAQIYQLIDELACQGKAILLVSSYLPELLGVCDRIAVMCRGKLSETRSYTDWDEHRLMAVATGQETA